MTWKKVTKLLLLHTASYCVDAALVKSVKDVWLQIIGIIIINV